MNKLIKFPCARSAYKTQDQEIKQASKYERYHATHAKACFRQSASIYDDPEVHCAGSVAQVADEERHGRAEDGGHERRGDGRRARSGARRRGVGGEGDAGEGGHGDGRGDGDVQDLGGHDLLARC